MVCLAPFVVLSLAPLAFAAATQASMPVAAFISLWNALGSALDLCVAGGLWKHMASGTVMRLEAGAVWVRAD